MTPTPLPSTSSGSISESINTKRCLKVKSQKESCKLRYGSSQLESTLKNKDHRSTFMRRHQNFRKLNAGATGPQNKRLSIRASITFKSVRNILGRNNDALDQGTAQDTPTGASNDPDALVVLSRERSVRFFDVRALEYEVVVSDNPAVSSGAAMELGWKYNFADPIPIDKFEEQRSKERSKNWKREKRLTSAQRIKKLSEFGATREEIHQATKSASNIRKKRKHSVATRDFDDRSEMIEDIITFVRKHFHPFRSSKKKQAAELERLHPSLFVGME